MSNQIQFNAFTFKSNSVRVITDVNQEPWFCGSDVCDILGYVNAPDALKKHCKEAGIAKRYISYPSGKKEAIFINEPNLYRLIIKSRKPEAEPFEAWVFEEVLPQIRKTGKYQVEPKQLALPAPEQTTLTPEEQRQVQNAVQATHNRTKLSYGEIWARVKNKFKVAKYEQIARTQLRDVLIYIASMSSTQDVVNGIVLSVEEFYALAKAIDYVNRSTYEWEQLTELFEMMESYKYCRNAHNLGIASNNIASTSERIIMRHAAQITDKHIREEIEKQFYSNPHVRCSTQLKVSNGLR